MTLPMQEKSIFLSSRMTSSALTSAASAPARMIIEMRAATLSEAINHAAFARAAASLPCLG
jgi:hypothetical protein